MGLVQRVRRLVTTGDDSTDGSVEQAGSAGTTDPADAAGGDGSAGSGDRTTQLFHCDSCDVTLVSEELASCPRCGGDVETVPTEDEVGIV